MKKIIIGALTTLLSVAIALVFISGVFAAPTPPTKHQTMHSSALTRTEAKTLTQTKPAITCTNKGTQIVNVTYKVINDADSGDAGNYWAYDAFTRQLQVWKDATTPGQFCADIKDTGSFSTQTGVRSPGSFPDGKGGYINGGVVDGTEVGTLSGGAVFTITGTFNANDPANWPALPSTNHNGNGGKTIDAGCVITAPAGTINAGCQRLTHSWEAKYFTPGYTDNITVWGWSYIGVDHAAAPDHGTSAGRWNNFDSGDSGDILDVD